MLKFPRAVCPPLITDEKPYPVLLLDENWCILHANVPALRAGLTPGLSVAAFLPADEMPRHRACLARDILTHYDPLAEPQNSAVYSLTGTPGYTLFYVEYVYTLKSAAIHAALFPGRREYLDAVTRSGRGSTSACQFLRRYMPSRSYGWHDILDARETPAMDRRLSAATLAMKCMHPSYYDGESDVLFSLHQILRIFSSEVIPHLSILDCRVDTAPLPTGEMFSRLEPDSLFLLLAALVCGMDGLSENRIIRMDCLYSGGVSTLCFSTRCCRMTRILRRSSDLSALIPAAPYRRHLWTLAEYIIGYCGYDIQILGEDPAGTLTLYLTLPLCRQSFEFKSPADEDRILQGAALTARCIGLLLDTQEDQ